MNSSLSFLAEVRTCEANEKLKFAGYLKVANLKFEIYAPIKYKL